MLYKQINFNDFIDSFKKADRDVFSYEGYLELFKHLGSLADWLELDIISIISSYTELSYNEIKQDYDLDEDATDEDIIEYIDGRSYIIYVGPDSILFEDF